MIFHNEHNSNSQINVFMLGDNNLRDDKYPGDDPSELFKIFAYIYSESKKISNCHVIFCSLIPSIVNFDGCNDIFMDFDASLKTLVDQEHEMVQVDKILRKKTGQVKEKLFQNDGIHLNDDGTDKITEQIFNRVRSTPRRFLQWKLMSYYALKMKIE